MTQAPRPGRRIGDCRPVASGTIRRVATVVGCSIASAFLAPLAYFAWRVAQL